MEKRKLYQSNININEINGLFNNDSDELFVRKKAEITPNQAKKILAQDLKIEGLRERTIKEYIGWYTRFFNFTKVEYVHLATKTDIYSWLDSMDVSNNTRLIRIKSLKAVLNRMYDRGWLFEKFWNNIKIRTDESIKAGTKPEEFRKLLNTLDLTNFFELRLAVAVFVMYKAGFRTTTLGQFREQHIDFEHNLFILSGDIMKNRQPLILPFNDQLATMLRIIIKENDKIRTFNGVDNDFIFITRSGETVFHKGNSTVIQKNLYAKAKEYNLKNINPHALRRGYAQNLRSQGADVVLISKALGHNSLEVTTRYLGIESDELITDLRKYQ